MKKAIFCFWWQFRIVIAWIVTTVVPFVVLIRSIGFELTLFSFVLIILIISISWDKLPLRVPTTVSSKQNAQEAWAWRVFQRPFKRKTRENKLKIIVTVIAVELFIAVLICLDSSYPAENTIAAVVGGLNILLVTALIGVFWIRIDEIVIRRSDTLLLKAVSAESDRT